MPQFKMKCCCLHDTSGFYDIAQKEGHLKSDALLYKMNVMGIFFLFIRLEIFLLQM